MRIARLSHMLTFLQYGHMYTISKLPSERARLVRFKGNVENLWAAIRNDFWDVLADSEEFILQVGLLLFTCMRMYKNNVDLEWDK